VQAAFVLLCASAVSISVARGGGKLSDGRLFVRLAKSSMGLLLTRVALLISSFIQARYYELSVYHGIIVVEISLINMWTALLAYSFVLGDTASALRRRITLNKRHNCSKVRSHPLSPLRSCNNSTCRNQEGVFSATLFILQSTSHPNLVLRSLPVSPLAAVRHIRLESCGMRCRNPGCPARQIGRLHESHLSDAR